MKIGSVEICFRILKKVRLALSKIHFMIILKMQRVEMVRQR